MNSDNETGPKESVKAEDSHEIPAEKILRKAKDAKPSPKKKILKQKKSQEKEDSIHSQAQNLRKLKGKEGRKNTQCKKGNRVTFLVKFFKQ